MLVKLLIFAIAAYVLFSVVRKLFVTKEEVQNKSSKKGELMIECHKCGTFMELNDSVMKDSEHYCSKECAGLK